MAIFSRMLTRPDIERRLTVPRYCVSEFPVPSERGQAIELKVKDEKGNVWTFDCSLQSAVRPRLVISSGWLQFVRSRELKVGDTIYFHKEAEQATEAPYKLEIRKDNSKSK